MTKRKNSKNGKKGAEKPTALQRRDAENLSERLAATPFTFVRRFSEEMDRLFEDFGLGRGVLTPMLDKAQLPRGLWSPQVEMFERDSQIVLRADLPGLTKDDVKVELANDGITIEGERKNEHEEEGEGFYRSERSYGKFYRRIPVPEGVNLENAQATFNNGVLEITMPATKPEARKARRLEITGEGQPRARAKAA
jgi:HSP20 family protein